MAALDSTFLVVGLGNPGARYEATPHNAGFMAIDALAHELDIDVRQAWAHSLIGVGMSGSGRVALAKPQTFMNDSGVAVAALLQKLETDLAHLLVIYDDVDLDAGVLRLRARGSAGTHNGMRSLLAHLRSDAFARARIGIGRPPAGADLAGWVLRRLGAEMLRDQQRTAEAAAKAALCWIEQGVDAAMRRFNGPAV